MKLISLLILFSFNLSALGQSIFTPGSEEYFKTPLKPPVKFPETRLFHALKTSNLYMEQIWVSGEDEKWKSTKRYTSTKNSNGHQTRFRTEEYDEEKKKWISTYNINFSYKYASGHRITQFNSTFTSTGFYSKTISKTSISHDFKNRIAKLNQKDSMFDTFSSGWTTIISETEYTYNSLNQLTSAETLSAYTGNTLAPSYRTRYLYDTDGKCEEIIEERYDHTFRQWNLYRKHQYLYDESGFMQYYTEYERDWSHWSPINNEHYYEHSKDGKLTRIEIETEGSWVRDLAHDFHYDKRGKLDYIENFEEDLEGFGFISEGFTKYHYDRFGKPYYAEETLGEINFPFKRYVYSFKDPITSPTSPQNLSVAVDTKNQNSLNLEWLDSSENEEGFMIYRGVSKEQLFLHDSVRAATTYKDRNLEYDKLYYYAVRAYNIAGKSGFTDTISEKTLLDASDIFKEPFRIYQTRNALQVSGDRVLDRITLMNLNGKLIAESNTTVVSTEGLSGLYLVSIESEGHIHLQKVLLR